MRSEIGCDADLLFFYIKKKKKGLLYLYLYLYLNYFDIICDLFCIIYTSIIFCKLNIFAINDYYYYYYYRCAPRGSRAGVLVGLAGVHPPSSRSLSITVRSGSWWTLLSSLRRPPVALSRTPVRPSYCPLPYTPLWPWRKRTRGHDSGNHIQHTRLSPGRFSLLTPSTRQNTPQTLLPYTLARTHKFPEHCVTRRKMSRTWLQFGGRTKNGALSRSPSLCTVVRAPNSPYALRVRQLVPLTRTVAPLGYTLAKPSGLYTHARMSIKLADHFHDPGF